MTSPAFDETKRGYRERVEVALDRYLPPSDATPRRLHEAMRYACLNGGKRIRAMLVYASGEAVDAKVSTLDRAACAVELVHAYSLVHDDLPAMDDDDLRRGKQTCHIAYDEATAILAGDSLLTLAFEVLASHSGAANGDSRRLKMIAALAEAAGAAGMTGGQSMDLDAVGRLLRREQLEDIYRRKTGALIRASVQLGALAGDPDPNAYAALETYGELIGVAFQITDDILDEVSDTSVLGKTGGADRARNKPTFPSILGLEASRDLAQDYCRRAMNCLDTLAKNAYTLRSIAEMVVYRTY